MTINAEKIKDLTNGRAFTIWYRSAKGLGKYSVTVAADEHQTAKGVNPLIHVVVRPTFTKDKYRKFFLSEIVNISQKGQTLYGYDEF
jgi:hypothetical protein